MGRAQRREFTRSAWIALLVALASLACSKQDSSGPGDEEAELFHNACARCHGPDGVGGPPDSLGNPGPRNFTDPTFQRTITDEKIVRTIENGNRGMPAFGAVLTPAQVKLMVAHVRKFGPRPESSAAPAPSGASSSRAPGP